MLREIKLHYQTLNSKLQTPLSLLTSSAKEAIIKGVSTPQSPQKNYLHFLNEVKNLNSIPSQSFWIVSTKAATAEMASRFEESQATAWVTPSLPLTMSQVLDLFDPRQFYNLLDFKNYQGAWIHPQAMIEEGVKIYPGAVIGAGVRILKGTEIRSQVTLEAFTEIGENCLIHAGSCLGSDGFGFYKDPSTGLNYKIPQIGKVTLGNEVEIGSQCAIDRATLEVTSIGYQTKLDNLVHIAHNTKIGSGGFFAAGFMCAGSVTIGNDFACGGDVVVTDHVSICDKVTIGGRSAVTKDIRTPGFYVGYPLEPYKEGLKTLSNLTNLTQMRKDLADLKKQFKYKDL